MNVLIINASPRKNGITTSLLAEAETTINSTRDADVVRKEETALSQ